MIGHAFFAAPCDSQLLCGEISAKDTTESYLQCDFGLTSTGLAGLQPAYLKMSNAAQRDRWCKPAFLATDTC